MQHLSLVETSGEDAEARLKARLAAEEHRGLLTLPHLRQRG